MDVWALGISAVEMAEVTPPRWSVHPMRVIFMISRDPPPRLADRDRWSLTFHDFVAQCLQKVHVTSVLNTCNAKHVNIHSIAALCWQGMMATLALQHACRGGMS